MRSGELEEATQTGRPQRGHRLAERLDALHFALEIGEHVARKVALKTGRQRAPSARSAISCIDCALNPRKRSRTCASST